MSQRSPHTSQETPHATERGQSAEKAAVGVRTPERAVQGRTDARAVLDASMSEAVFQATVIELAKRTGWLVHHQTIPYRIGKDGKPRAIVEPNTDPGFNDLVLVHRARGLTVFPELKSESGRLSKDQERWGEALLAAGCDWRLWFPHDWPEIEALLKGE